MLGTMAVSELKNLMRERMTQIMLFYPFVLGGIGKYLIDTGYLEGPAVGIISILFILMAGFAYGATAGFSLLDDRDDQVLISIAISPVPLRLYVWLKVGFVTLLGALVSAFVIWYMDVIQLGLGDLLLLALLCAMQAPITALVVNAFAKNKVEGYVTMKATGFLLFLPVGAFFFLDAKEWLFAIAPGHWAAKAIQVMMLQPEIEAGVVQMNLGFHAYIGIGLVYNLLLIVGLYRLFERKNLL